MKNPLKVMSELVETIPIGNELMFKATNGDVMSVKDAVGIKGTIVERSKDEAVKNVLTELFGDNNITSTMYVDYLNVMTAINDVVVKSLSQSARNYLKKTNKGRELSLVEFPNMRGRKIQKSETPNANLKWNKEAIIKIAADCKTRTDLKEKNGSAYKSALKFGWLDEIFN
jgi:hypothetical protein